MTGKAIYILFNRVKIFIDFDDVLFNTKKFKNDYFSIFKKNGISKKVFEDCYYDESEEGKDVKKYDPIRHVKKACEISKVKINILQKDINRFIKDTSRYVFSDTDDFLNSFRKKDLCLISFSKTKFQWFKIFKSGIAGNLKKIEIVDELKAKIIGKIIREEKLAKSHDLYFIDDRAEQIRDVKMQFPQIKTILMKRKEGRYKDQKNKYCDFECSNFKQAKKVIKSQ